MPQRDWIDLLETHCQPLPVEVRRAIAFLDGSDGEVLQYRPDFGWSVINSTRRLIADLERRREIINGDFYVARNHHEPPDVVHAFDGGVELTRDNLFFQSVTVLIVRLRKLLPPAEDDPPAPAHTGRVIPFGPRGPTIAVAIDDDDAPLVEEPPAPRPPVIAHPPANYYSGQHWHGYTAENRRMWGYACALNVGHKGPIEIHHRTYERLGHEAPLDGIALCEECHARVHDRLPRQRSFDFQKQAA